MTTAKDILQIIKEIKPEIDIESDTDLFEAGIVDSFIIFNKLIPMLEDRFSIEITPLDLIPENFLNTQSLADFIEEKLNG